MGKFRFNWRNKDNKILGLVALLHHAYDGDILLGISLVVVVYSLDKILYKEKESEKKDVEV